MVLRSDAKSNFREKWKVLAQTLEDVTKNEESCFLTMLDRRGESGEIQNSTFEDEGGGGAFFKVTLVLKGAKRFPTFPPEQR